MDFPGNRDLGDNADVGDYKYYGKFILGQYGDYASGVKYNERYITVNKNAYANNEITFSKNDLNDIEKGVAYNVINQVLITNSPKITDWWNGPYNLSDDDKYSESLYFLSGEFITNYNTFYGYRKYESYYSGTYSALIRHTEYKWGELVFASRPDPVEDLTFNADGTNLTWSKPLDEGFGVESDDNAKRTRKDDVVYVTDYTAVIYDEKGSAIYSTNILRDKTTDEVKIDLPEGLIERDQHYKAVVICTNILGDSDERVAEIYIPTPKVKIVMTPDQPVYRENDTVVYTETVTNTGKVKLTEVIVTQDKPGTYDTQEGLIPLEGTSAQIPDLEPGESYTFI